jgi:hypothetical protein
MRSKKFLTGSNAVFRDYIKNFTSKDENYIQFNTKATAIFDYTEKTVSSKLQSTCVMSTVDKDILLNLFCNFRKEGIIVFLIPETAKYLGVTLEWLKQKSYMFEFIFQNLQEKFEYIKQIYNYYLENNMMYLKVTQRQKVYETYLKYRQK